MLRDTSTYLAVSHCAFAFVRVFALAGVVAHADSRVSHEFFAVCDAGSSGTRVYIFRRHLSGGVGLKIRDINRLRTVQVKTTKPGLSSYAHDPKAAVKSFLSLFQSVAGAIPENQRKATPVAIYGTAGMRALDAKQQGDLWSEVEAGLRESDEFPFSTERLELRTATGEDEGRWAMLSANYLASTVSDNLHHDEQSPPFVGVLDLGGASEQIAFPLPVASKSRDLEESTVFANSLQGFGMAKVLEHLHTRHGHEAAVCYMPGHAVEIEGISTKVTGAGDGPACRQLLKRIIHEKVFGCQSRSLLSLSRTGSGHCPGNLSSHPQMEVARRAHHSIEFYAINGYYHAVKHVHWWINGEEASRTASLDQSILYKVPVGTIREAADKFCASNWFDFRAALETSEQLDDHAQHRCFQVHYITVLLEEVHGFLESETITFTLAVNGEPLQWPLGAFLEALGRDRHEDQNAGLVSEL